MVVCICIVVYAALSVAALFLARRGFGPWMGMGDFLFDSVVAVLWPLSLLALACARAAGWLRKWSYGADRGGI